MVRHGKNFMENENNMVNVIVLVTPLFLWACSELFLRYDWKVRNFVGEEIPYSLGACLFIVVIFYLYILNIDVRSTAIFYLIVLWVSGFIDDRFGTKYPKGLKGHINLFIQHRKVSTGLLKLTGTVMAAFLFVVNYKWSGIIQFFSIFLLLVLTPHVMNLFDTRPLRVWKVILLHGIMFFPLLFQVAVQLIGGLVVVFATFVYFEANRKAMLGDNGATLLGGVVSLLMIYHSSLTVQWLIILIYLFIIVVTEKISLSEWIEARPVLKWIDRWGVS